MSAKSQLSWGWLTDYVLRYISLNIPLCQTLSDDKTKLIKRVLKQKNAKTFKNWRLWWLLYFHADRLRDWLTWSTLFYLLLCWLILQTKSSWRQENSSSIQGITVPISFETQNPDTIVVPDTEEPFSRPFWGENRLWSVLQKRMSTENAVGCLFWTKPLGNCFFKNSVYVWAKTKVPCG